MGLSTLRPDFEQSALTLTAMPPANLVRSCQVFVLCVDLLRRIPQGRRFAQVGVRWQEGLSWATLNKTPENCFNVVCGMLIAAYPRN
jgi:hypothetical protein